MGGVFILECDTTPSHHQARAAVHTTRLTLNLMDNILLLIRTCRIDRIFDRCERGDRTRYDYRHLPLLNNHNSSPSQECSAADTPIRLLGLQVIV